MLHLFTSTVRDGSMKTLPGDSFSGQQNRVAYLERIGLDPAAATLHTLSYGGSDYCRYAALEESDKGDGMTREATIDVDAVVVTKPNHAILLPLADCIGAVIHDPVQNILMVSHLGRHNLQQDSGAKCIDYLVEKHGVNLQNLTVWLSPAAGGQNYPLYAFDNRSMYDIATEQLVAAGVKQENISTSPIDVTTDTNYYSHSQFLKNRRPSDGRFCIVAVMN